MTPDRQALVLHAVLLLNVQVGEFNSIMGKFLQLQKKGKDIWREIS